jgi:hypothetical protein
MDRDLSIMDSESIANFCAITDSSDTTAEYFLSVNIRYKRKNIMNIIVFIGCGR